MNTLLILFCIVGLSRTDNNGHCFACKNDGAACTTAYSPSVPVMQACDSQAVHLDLCRRYGDYSLSCSRIESGGGSSFRHCTGSCSSSSRSAPSITVLFITSAVLILVMKSVQ